MSRWISRRISQAFTLIELLVVIAIIALLIALIMPSLSNAKEAARGIQCASNEHNIMVGVLSYAPDNRNMFPTGWNGAQSWDVLVKPYGVPLEILLCPSHADQTRHYWTNANIDSGQSGGSTQTGVMCNGFSVATDSLIAPSNTVTFTEIREWKAAYALGGISVPGSGWGSMLYAYQDLFILQYRHLGRENVAFGDGHYEQQTRKQLETEGLANGFIQFMRSQKPLGKGRGGRPRRN